MDRRDINNKALETWLTPTILVILTIIISYFNIYVGIFALALSVFAIYKTLEMNANRKNELRDHIDKLDMKFDGITKKAIFKMPYPIAVLNDSGQLLWYNNKFKEMTGDQSTLVDRKLTDIIPTIELDKLAKLSQIKSKNQSDKDKDSEVVEDYIIEYRYKKYAVKTNFVEDKNKEKNVLLYLLDTTDYRNLLEVYEAKKLSIVNLQLDNYDELVSTTPNERRPLLFAQIDRVVSLYFHDHGCAIKKYENDKYIGVINKLQLDEFIEDKFSLVDKIRETKLGNTIPPTLSIGIGLNEDTPRSIEKSANAALDIALGRGGDQIVIKDNEDLEYFGGKNKATEKRTKVKARVIAHALGQLIDKSTEVFVMGHKNPDMDSFGSALGIMHAVQRKGKNVYLVLSEVTPSIKNLYNRAMDTIDNLDEIIIKPNQAYERVRSSSLLIITDNHRRNSTEEPRLFEKTSSVVIIDHHRRGKDYIDNATLIYLEPYASSASELVTEMLMYMDGDMDINKTVAEGLLAGIAVDTKNFFYQTGVRTFEAASVLKRHGADSSSVKQLFKDDFTMIKYKSEIISTAERFLDKYAIGIYAEENDSSNLVASQAADELLNADGIEASFVLTRVAGKTHISARSLGNISAQILMEKLDGGGHLTSAATQLDMSIEEARERLIQVIESEEKGE